MLNENWILHFFGGALSLDKVLMVILLRSTLVVLFPRCGGAVRRCLCEKNGGM